MCKPRRTAPLGHERRGLPLGFCEQRGDYLTLEHLALHHWEYLYQEMPLVADRREPRVALGIQSGGDTSTAKCKG